MSEEKTGKRSIKDTFIWSVLELVIVPISLACLSFYLNDSVSKRDQMKEYLKDITDLASKVDEKNQNKKLGDIPSLRNLGRSRTLTVLHQSDDQSKREIIEFLANSDLHYQISLNRADLRNADLSGLYLKDADLRRADLRGANLTDTKLQGVDLRDAILDSGQPNKIQYDKCTRYDEKLKSMMGNWEETDKDRPKDDCHHKDKK